MKEGGPIKQRMDLSIYESPNLDLSTRRTFEEGTEYFSCGTAGLSLVTGLHVRTVQKYNPKRNGGSWYTGRIIKFLRSKGFTVIEVSKHLVTSSDQYNPMLKFNHCLLINARVDDENSLYTVHKGEVYHHFDKQSNAGPLFFLNKPTQDVLLVWHKKWGYTKKEKLYYTFGKYKFA